MVKAEDSKRNAKQIELSKNKENDFVFEVEEIDKSLQNYFEEKMENNLR